MENITIAAYQPQWQPYFEELNRKWIEKFFELEDSDRFILRHPDKAILRDGGAILIALENERVIGTVALKWSGDDTLELEKLSVDESSQGRGVGKKLCEAAIEKARSMKAQNLILYSNSILRRALNLYEKLGFKYMQPGDNNGYKRVDIKMELKLREL